jgi:homoserine O-acetyltransferase
LYHPYLQREFHEQLVAQGTPSDYHVIESPHGHDGFLIEFDRLAPIITEFLKRIEKNDG